MTQTQPETTAAGTAKSRTRTYTWNTPAVTQAALAGRPGLEVLTAILRGELPPPPVMSTLDIEPGEVGEGWITFRLTPQEMHYNPLGTVHGGVLATLLDSATGCAVHSTLPAGFGYTSVDLTTKYLRPVTVETGPLTATGKVLSRGSRTALAEARLTDERDRLLAHATSTCMIFDVR
jgi:uncharacterized protein (TIGR00369 family)